MSTKKTKKKLPCQRSLEALRKYGWSAHKVDRWIAQARKSIDVAGFGDILAWNPELRTTALVQTTTRKNLAARITKIVEECYDEAHRWLATQPGNVIIVHGWILRGGVWVVDERLFSSHITLREKKPLTAYFCSKDKEASIGRK